MAFICFECHALHLNVPLLMDHYRNIHHFGALRFQMLYCRQPGCARYYDSLESLGNHLLSHVDDNGVVNDDNHFDDNFIIFENEIAVPPEANHIQPVHVEAEPDILDEPVERVPLTIGDFVTVVSSSSLSLCAKLYSDPELPREHVQTIMNYFSTFLTGSYLSHLKDKVYSLLPIQNRQELDDYFKIVQNPFIGLDTEHQRFNAFSSHNKLVKVQTFNIGIQDRINAEAELEVRPAEGHFLPMRDVLKNFLEMPNVLNTITTNMTDVENNVDGFSDYLQSESWRHHKSHFDGKLVLPIFLHTDAYDPDNVNGSHAGDHSTEGLYYSLPCIPKEYQASLESMFISSLCLSKFKGEGNAVIFDPVLDELDFLHEVGINVHTVHGDQQVYFVLAMIIGDNKGLNEVLGFQPGFGANYFCRICKMSKEVALFQTYEDPALLRTVENYNNDVALQNPAITGVRENCVFNGIAGYHCISNASVDLSHDILEGICKYGMSHVLYNLIYIRQYFSQEDLEYIVNTFDYGVEEGNNKPPASKLSQDRIQSRSINFSASEMLCFVRHFGLMVGHLVPANDDVWLYFLKLQEIVDFVLSPVFRPGWEVYLSCIVQEHHELYINLFNDTLKPKHHLLLHYARRISLFGPPVHYWAMDLERKHRQSKQYARVCLNRMNITFTLMLKHSLQLCYLFLSGVAFRNVIKLSASETLQFRNVNGYNDLKNLIGHQGDSLCEVSSKSAVTYGNTYRNNCILLYSSDEIVPLFGKVTMFLKFNLELLIVMKTLITVEKNDHINSYKVVETEELLVVNHRDLLCYKPLHSRFFEGNYYVTPRYVI